MRALGVGVVLLAILAAACTPNDSDPAFPTEPVVLSEVSELPASPGDLVTVYGFFFDTPTPRLCGLSLDSDPRQCGGFSVGLPAGFDAAFGSLITVRGELTSSDTITVHSFTYGDSTNVDEPTWIVVP
jgi:hypothetical protein